MKTLFIVLALMAALLLSATSVLAYCTYQTYFINGRMVTCTTCCSADGRQCQTSCI